MSMEDCAYLLVKARFRVRCDIAPAAELLRNLLRPFEVEEAAATPAGTVFDLTRAGADFELRRWEDRIRTATHWRPLVQVLLEEMNRSALANFDGFACHAGVVAQEERAIAFPAPSEAGKSTLTAACLLSGFDYVSDEALCVDLATEELIKYPRPLELSAWSRAHLGIGAPQDSGFLQVGDIGGVVASGDVRLRHIIFLERRDGAPALEDVSQAQVVTGLLRNSFNHYKHPEASFKLATKLASSCRGWKVLYDSALDAAELVRTQLFE